MLQATSKFAGVIRLCTRGASIFDRPHERPQALMKHVKDSPPAIESMASATHLMACSTCGVITCHHYSLDGNSAVEAICNAAQAEAHATSFTVC